MAGLLCKGLVLPKDCMAVCAGNIQSHDRTGWPVCAGKSKFIIGLDGRSALGKFRPTMGLDGRSAL